MEVTRTEAADPTLEQINSLYSQGKYLDVYELTKKLGPLQELTDPAYQLIGGRLAHNLGSHRLGRIMHRAAYRQNPTHHETLYFYFLSMAGRWSPLETWEKLKAIGGMADAPAKIQADWHIVRAQSLCQLRDFERAEKEYDEALKIAPARAWLYVCKTTLLEMQDRAEEGLECAQQAFELEPWYRPAVQNLAYSLVQMNRDDEALTLLREGIERIQSGDLRVQLAALYLELQMYEEAREIYQSIPKYHPLMHLDKHRTEWHAARLADAAYYCGDFQAVPAHAEKADSDFYKTLAKNVKEKDGKRVILPVNFVRQHHMTCAPATLTAISEYWEKPAQHLDVVEEICYDGTPAHSERRWAESSDYVTREFRVTLETAKLLIDRGCPFTLTTVNPGNAHLQAVIGYDTYRESLIIRDPGERHFAEFETQEMLKHYAASGPRGMVLVPKEKAELLDGIEFAEAELYDLFYQVELKLEAHKRDEASLVVEQMKSIDAEHRLTLRARGNVASYDGDTRELLELADATLELFPDDVNTKMSKFIYLMELGERDQRIKLLESMIDKKDCDPLFWGRYAAEIADDAREQDTAMRYLRKVVRYRPHDIQAYGLMAMILMDQEKQDDAFELYRFAACIGDMSEGPARAYFSASRVVNKPNTVLRFLKDRFDRFAKKSSYPTRTFCWALDQLSRTDDCFKVLKKGLSLRPDDSELMLYYSDFCGRYGKQEQAAKLLEAAKDKSHKTMWLRTAALQLFYKGEPAAALPYWKEVAEADPLDCAAQRYVADLTADTEGDDAAVQYLRGVVDRFEYSYGLRMLLIEWLRDEQPEKFEAELNRFVELHSNDAWALRELAFHKLKTREFEKATELADQAEEIEPNHPALEYVRGRAAQSQNKIEDAKAHYREAVKISIDYDFAIIALLGCCDAKAERVEELKFVYEQMNSQVNFGDGLLTFASRASETLGAKSVLKRLQSILDKRPDLWQAWSAVSHQLSEVQRHEEAIELATKATERFPMLPRTWIDLAMANAACGKIDGEIAALERALEINSNWGEPVRLLAEAHEKKGDLDLARSGIERMITMEPRDVRNLGFLANIMWNPGEKQEAVDTVVKAVRMQPGYSWAWSALRTWGAELKQNELVIEVSRDLTKKRPQDYRSWLTYARSLAERDQIDEACAAMDKAIAINPTNPEAYSQKAFQLSRAGRFEEAIAAARPSAFGDSVPLELQSREAWIEGERGNVETAVSKMEKIVREDRDYFWAWHRLAEWYEFLERKPKYLRAAKEMVRIAPLDCVSWGYLGDAELRQGRKKVAKKHFTQALQLSPDYNFAATRLVDLQLEDREYDAALKTIDTVAPHIAPAWALSEKIRIESLRGDEEKSLALLRQLAVTPEEDSSAIDAAVESLFHAKLGKKVLPVLNELLTEPNAQPGVAYVFVHLSSTLKEWDSCVSRMDSLLTERPELWKEGAKKLVVEFATGDAEPRLHKFVKKHKRELFKDAELWEAVGDAYNSASLFKKTLSWMKDWRSREGLTFAMAHTVAMAHWELKQPHKAVEISRYAFKNLEPDGTFHTHLTLIAFYELIYGALEPCVDAVSMVDPSQLGGLYHLMFQYTVTTLENLSQQGSYRELANSMTEIWTGLPEGVRHIPFLVWINALCEWRAADLHGKRFKAFKLKRRT